MQFQVENVTLSIILYIIFISTNNRKQIWKQTVLCSMQLPASAYQAAQYASTLGGINNQVRNMERNCFCQNLFIWTNVNVYQKEDNCDIMQNLSLDTNQPIRLVVTSRWCLGVVMVDLHHDHYLVVKWIFKTSKNNPFKI